MKLLLLPLFALFSSTIAYASQRIIVQEGEVPGKSPLKHCTSSTTNDLLTIEKVDLDPNPPLAGKTLVVHAKGNFKEEIKDGAYARVHLKYRKLITIINKQFDLCQVLEKANLTCPLDKGPADLTLSVDLPGVIPPGDYDVTADCFTVDDAPITCLTADVNFS